MFVVCAYLNVLIRFDYHLCDIGAETNKETTHREQMLIEEPAVRGFYP